MLVHAPNRAEAEHMIAVIMGERKFKGWCNNARAQHVDVSENFRGGKRISALGYILKAADPRSVYADRTILWKPSGAVVGPRVKISKNLTNPEVVAATAVGVETFARIRKERADADRVRRARNRVSPFR